MLLYMDALFFCIHVCQIHVHTILTSRYEECVSLANGADVALRDEVTEKHLTLIGRHHPLLVANQILLRGRDEVEHLLPADHVVPDRRSSKINVEVGVAVLDSHKTVLLNQRATEKTKRGGEKGRGREGGREREW